jgi:hypothetical protein
MKTFLEWLSGMWPRPVYDLVNELGALAKRELLARNMPLPPDLDPRQHGQKDPYVYVSDHVYINQGMHADNEFGIGYHNLEVSLKNQGVDQKIIDTILRSLHSRMARVFEKHGAKILDGSKPTYFHIQFNPSAKFDPYGTSPPSGYRKGSQYPTPVDAYGEKIR